MSDPNGNFGAIFAAPALEEGLQDLLAMWLPSYLTEVERQAGLNPCTLARPKFYGTSVEADLHPGEGMPAIIVVSPGTDGIPEGEGGGIVTAWYQVTVATLVMASDEHGARQLSAYYSGAVRAVVMQHGSIGGVADGVQWLGEEFQGEPPSNRNRSRGGALTHFRIRIPVTVEAQSGPTFPAPIDPCADVADLVTVQTVEINVEGDEIDPLVT